MAIRVANNQSLTAITALPSAVSGGAMTLLATETASSSDALSFTSNIDSDYKEYVFKFIDIHASNEGSNFTFNMSVDGGSNYNVTKTSTHARAYHAEADNAAAFSYSADGDLAQSTGFQNISHSLNDDNDASTAGTLHLFDPSSTTFVKHFIINTNSMVDSIYSYHNLFGGYGNTTSAVDAVQFKMSAGTIDAGVIKLYGIS